MTDDVAAHNSREYRDAVRRLLTSLTRLRGLASALRAGPVGGLGTSAAGPATLRLRHYGSREWRRCATHVSHAVPVAR